MVNGCRVGEVESLHVVVAVCREPEKHQPGEKYCVVTYNTSLEKAESEAEKIWLEINESPSRPS